MKHLNAVKNVLIYCRESRDDGYANYERIETQRDMLITFCEKRKLGRIIDIVMDDNVSGTDFSRLTPVKERIRQGEVDVFVCKDASRIGRHLLDSLQFITFLEQHRVTLIFESEAYNEDIFPLIAWFNERRVKEDSLKIRRVLRHKMTTGEMVIKAPFGYDKKGNTLVIDETAAPIVREIFTLYAGGMGSYAIAALMNRKGYPTPSQLKAQYAQVRRTPLWNKQHIERIVTHVIYTGDMPYGMREKVNYKSAKYIRKDKADWIIIPRHHEPIVDRALFEAAQQRRKTQKYKRYEVTEKQQRLFSGLVYCGRCGSKMYAKTRKGRKPALICSKYNAEGSIKAFTPALPRNSGTVDGTADGTADGTTDYTFGCTPHRVYEADLWACVSLYITQLIAQHSRYPTFQETEIEAKIGTEIETEIETKIGIEIETKIETNIETDIRNDTVDCIEKKIARLTRQRDALHDKASRVYEDKLNGVLPDFLFENTIRDITTALNRITDEINRLANQRQQRKPCSNPGNPGNPGNPSNPDNLDNPDNPGHLFLATLQQDQGIFTNDDISLLFKKIILLAPNDISADYLTTYRLSSEAYAHLQQKGGVLFVQNFQNAAAGV